jgi:programmed cell death 6-interacting protein
MSHRLHRAQAFKAVFEVPAWRAACEGAAGGIRAILKTYKEVLDHLSEGLRFYMSLQVGAKFKLEVGECQRHRYNCQHHG